MCVCKRPTRRLQDWHVLHNQAVCCSLSGLHAEAVEVFARALVLCRNEQTYMQLARSQLKLGAPVRAGRGGAWPLTRLHCGRAPG